MSSPFLESHSFFIHSETTGAECTTPMHDRWIEILEDAPELNVPLFELANIRVLYERAYKEASGNRLEAYLNHAYLLAHYLHFLHVNGMIVGHAHAIEIAHQQVWISRFFERCDKTKTWRRGGKGRTRISKPYLPDTAPTERQIFH